jgi:hypothetical protein
MDSFLLTKCLNCKEMHEKGVGDAVQDEFSRIKVHQVARPIIEANDHSLLLAPCANSWGYAHEAAQQPE